MTKFRNTGGTWWACRGPCSASSWSPSTSRASSWAACTTGTTSPGPCTSGSQTSKTCPPSTPSTSLCSAASATRKRGSRGRHPTSASTGRWATRPLRSSMPQQGRTSWAVRPACVSTPCTVAGCVCTARFPPTYCAPRSLNPTCTTNPNWWPRSTRPPRRVCSKRSSRQGWAPGWRSPPSRISSLSPPDRGRGAEAARSSAVSAAPRLSRGGRGDAGCWASSAVSAASPLTWGQGVHFGGVRGGLGSSIPTCIPPQQHHTPSN
uniref:Uncharacterized protein n=1 Tax=Canis lupus familiaris TaxID=9615 RepID=A0A8C0RT97_CANLF